ncbi:hypothetical protein [Roseimicrobium sp. ORNL1]|uniref:hypothetical protein n=1 Tax=Roseimicrobium sp. ORNL1 TaxID=2711231 RepID=UPI0013E19F3E|nr:hypothetical protein [Roseimicrobium sp. ORNL1]QIE99988.1 hypothetical protein G5S37_00090 [Roseimicrobium sp. ORNL1]
MPESNSPYATTAAPQVLDLLRSQLVSVTEDRRRVMLWSAILAVGALMLVGRVNSLPWFLSLVPLTLLTVWHACLLVRQRRYQAAWDTLLEKSADNIGSGPCAHTGPTRKAAAAASAQASQELGIGSTPAILGALAAPSVLLFHGLLLGAVVTGGVVHEVEREKHSTPAALAHEEDSTCGCGGGGGTSKVASAGEKSGSGCGCGGGSGSSAVAATAPVPKRTPGVMVPARTLNNAPRVLPTPSNGVAAAPGRPITPFPTSAPRPQPQPPRTATPAPSPVAQPPATLRPEPVTGAGAMPSAPAQPAPPVAPPAAPKPETHPALRPATNGTPLEAPAPGPGQP